MTSSRNRRRPIMPFYVEDYRNGVADLSAEQRGVYVSLLAIMWDSRAPLIDDTSAIARRISLNTRLVARVIGELVAIGKLVRCDGLIFNRRVMREVEKYDARDAAPSDNHDDARPQVINRPSAPRKASQKKPDAALKSELNGSQDANPVEIRKQKQRPSSPTPTHIQSIDNASNSQTPRCGSDFRSKDDLIELGAKASVHHHRSTHRQRRGARTSRHLDCRTHGDAARLGGTRAQARHQARFDANFRVPLLGVERQETLGGTGARRRCGVRLLARNPPETPEPSRLHPTLGARIGSRAQGHGSRGTCQA